MATTRYFEEQVRRKRPYLRCEWIEAAVIAPIRRVVQPDGRHRCWIEVDDGGTVRVLRVVLLDDGVTVHHASSIADIASETMKLHYYPETDSLYIELQAAAGVDTREVAEGIVADLGADGSVVGLDLDRASRFDLGSIETGGLPALAA